MFRLYPVHMHFGFEQKILFELREKRRGSLSPPSQNRKRRNNWLFWLYMGGRWLVECVRRPILGGATAAAAVASAKNRPRPPPIPISTGLNPNPRRDRLALQLVTHIGVGGGKGGIGSGLGTRKEWGGARIKQAFNSKDLWGSPKIATLYWALNCAKTLFKRSWKKISSRIIHVKNEKLPARCIKIVSL